MNPSTSTSHRTVVPPAPPAATLLELLTAAQRLERRLWSLVPELGGHQCALAEAAEMAWVRLHDEAEAIVVAPLPGLCGREQRLAAALLLAVLDASEPGHVARLQELARQISDVDDCGRASRPGPVAELLHFVACGPFVMSGAVHSGVAPKEGGGDVASTA